MSPSTSPTRRRFTAAASGAVLAAVAGCLDGGNGGEPTTPTAGRATDSPRPTDRQETDSQTAPETEASTPTDTESPSDADLDRREANVVDVAVSEEGDGRFRFDVTLHHDDAGEDGYANWWQIETVGGEQLGRRDLDHPHGTQPFTRGATIDVPAEKTCVVARGHDQTHGYGGRAVLVSPETGATRAIDQGSDRQSVEREGCP